MATPTPTPSPGSLARNAHARVLGLLILGVLAAAGLGYSGYQIHAINSVLAQAAESSLNRNEAQSLLNEMEISFTRFLLDGNSANLALIQRDRDSLEQLAQRDASRNDAVIQNQVAQEKRWYTQVQPLIELRKNVPPGQGLSEDFMAHYRASGTALELVNPQAAAQGFESFTQSAEFVQLRTWLSVGYLAAAILMVLAVCWLAWGAFKNVAGLKKSSS